MSISKRDRHLTSGKVSGSEAKDVGLNRIRRALLGLCLAVDTPVSLAQWLRFKYGEFHQLVDKSIDPNDYNCATVFKGDYLICEYLSKSDFLPVDIDPKAAALDKFIQAEKTCLETNRRISRFSSVVSPRVSTIFHMAQRKIALVLGSTDDLDMNSCSWGPGATTSLKGVGSSKGDKIREFPVRVSPAALPWLKAVLSTDIHWLRCLGIDADGPCCVLDSCFGLEHHARITTVPKKSTCDRTIGIEPTGNIFLQKGIGSFIRRRLKRFGVDLDLGHLSHRALACEGSLEGKIATVDLSAASDTISFQLILSLLPPDWFCLLDDCRSKTYKLPDGSTSHYEKFSAMGNGFTFELESLVFWALAQSVEDTTMNRHVTVFGDDIILSVESLPLLKEVFDFSGFTMNMKKTHYNSLFRESCGGHFFNGIDVTPIYQKTLPSELPDIYRFANRIRRYAFIPSLSICDSSYKGAWLGAISNVDIKHYVPISDSSDDGLACCFDELSDYIRTQRGGGFTLPTLVWCSETKRRYIASQEGYAFNRRSSTADREDGIIPNTGIRLPYGLAYKLGLFPDLAISVQTDVATIRGRGAFRSRRRYFSTGRVLAPWV